MKSYSINPVSYTHLSIGVVRINEESLSCDIGYVLSKKLWGRGIATEAAQAVIRFLFEEVGFERITALHHYKNQASGRVMQKLSMEYIRTIPDQYKDNRGNPCPVIMYEIRKESYEAKKQRP